MLQLGEQESKTYRNGGRAPSLRACLALTIACDKRRSAWTPEAIASLRFSQGQAREDVQRKITDWLRYRLKKQGLKNIAVFTKREMRALLVRSDHLERGRLALKLENLVLGLCRANPTGPNQISFSLENRIDGLPTSEIRTIVEALEGGFKHGDVEDMRRIAGPGLAQAWREHFGENRKLELRRNAQLSLCVKQKNLTQKNQAESIGSNSAEGGKAGTQKKSTCVKEESISKAQDNNALVLTTSTASPISKNNKHATARHKIKRIAVVLFFGLFLSAASYNYIFDQQLRAFRTLIELGSREGLDTLYAQLKGKKHADYDYYLKASAQYLAANLEQARTMANRIIASEPDDYTHGVCFYLLGLIERDSGSPEVALGYFHNSMKYFKKNQFTQHFLVHLETAKTYLGIQEAGKAETFFSLAEKARKKANKETVSQYDYYYFETMGRILFSRNDFVGALEALEHSKKYITNSYQKFGYHAWRSWFLWYGGNHDLALIDLDEAQYLVDNQRMQTHLDTVKIAIRNCQGLDYSVLEKSVQSWLERHPSVFLESKLFQAKNPCN